MKRTLSNAGAVRRPKRASERKAWSAKDVSAILEIALKQARFIERLNGSSPFATADPEWWHPKPVPAPAGHSGRAPDPPRYLLRKELNVWKLVFDGKEGLIRNDRAMPLVAFLLKNPPAQPIHALVLEMRVWAAMPHEVASHVVTDRASEGEPVDMDALLQQVSGRSLQAGTNTLLKRKVAELLETRDDLSLPQEERDDAEAKLGEIHASIFGKAGRATDEASRAVDRVRKAITRLYEKLTQPSRDANEMNGVLRLFGEHLKEYLLIPSARYARGRGSRNRAGVAGTFTYEPPPGVVWRG